MYRGRMRNRKKFKPCTFCADKVDDIDFKDTIKLKRYLTERGKILPRRITGNCSFHQRKLATCIKKARENALIPYIFEG